MRYVPASPSGYAILCNNCLNKRVREHNHEVPGCDAALRLDADEDLESAMPDEAGVASCADCDCVDDGENEGDEPYDVRDSREYVYAHRHD